jgi:hypothetical protein
VACRAAILVTLADNSFGRAAVRLALDGGGERARADVPLARPEQANRCCRLLNGVAHADNSVDFQEPCSRLSARRAFARRCVPRRTYQALESLRESRGLSTSQQNGSRIRNLI